MDTAKPRTIFITGATGLVGGHAAEEALRRGHRVRALVRASSDTRWLDQLGVEKVPGDLEDAESLRRGVAGADWVFNCAAKVGDWGTLAEFRRLNVDALRLLLDAACDAQVERFVHVSSLGVYAGRDHHGTDETVPPAASSLDAYTRSKTEAEALVLKYHKERSLPAAIVRPGFIYGERDRTVLPKLLMNLRRGTFAYFGSGEQALNCIYVKNLVHGIFLAAENPAALGEFFNLTDGEPVSKIRFVSRVAELAGLRPPTRHIPLGLARLLATVVEGGAKLRGARNAPIINKARFKFLGLHLDYSIDKARRILGYQPPYSFDEAIERAMAEHRPRASGKPCSRRVAYLITAGFVLQERVGNPSPERSNVMSNLKGKRVAVLVEKLYEDLELWYPVLRLREAGADVTIVGPRAGETYLSKHDYPARSDAAADEVKAQDLDAVIIPGGYSPDHMRRHPAMVDLVTQAGQMGKVLAAICHGPWMLCSARCLSGRKVTGFFAIRDDVVNAGGIWQDAACVRDGNLVTSRTPDDLPAFMQGIFAALVEVS